MLLFTHQLSRHGVSYSGNGHHQDQKGKPYSSLFRLTHESWSLIGKTNIPIWQEIEIAKSGKRKIDSNENPTLHHSFSNCLPMSLLPTFIHIHLEPSIYMLWNMTAFTHSPSQKKPPQKMQRSLHDTGKTFWPPHPQNLWTKRRNSAVPVIVYAGKGDNIYKVLMGVLTRWVPDRPCRSSSQTRTPSR